MCPCGKPEPVGDQEDTLGRDQRGKKVVAIESECHDKPEDYPIDSPVALEGAVECPEVEQAQQCGQ